VQHEREAREKPYGDKGVDKGKTKLSQDGLKGETIERQEGDYNKETRKG
jgi:hypothetical protein